jgi:hypothetical protein
MPGLALIRVCPPALPSVRTALQSRPMQENEQSDGSGDPSSQVLLFMDRLAT